MTSRPLLGGNLEGLTGWLSCYGLSMRTAPEFLLVGEAAERLGVAVQTIRNWIAAGKLRAKRHPMNQYRLISKADIEKIHRQLGRPSSVRHQR
jgi:excisionase family DNA binding protein